MNELVGILLLIFSVMLGGGIVVFLHKANKSSITKLLLSLSGGFLVAITFIHFIPEIYIHNDYSIGYYILLGFLIQLFLEYFSGGIEHGHIHVKSTSGAIPWSLFISLSIHSIIEGIPLEAQFHTDGLALVSEVVTDHHHHHHHHGASSGIRGLLLGVILHNIPVGIALMTLLIASGFKQLKAWLLLFIFALMGPIGVLLGHYGAAAYLIDLELLLAVVVGMFLHISTTIIFEASENHRFNAVKLVSLLIGVALAVITV
jgi:zinc transporter ZupT